MTTIKPIATLALIFILASCSSVKVIVDNKKKPDFTKYETYNFISWQDLDDDMFSAADKKLLEDSFVEEFNRRGFKRVGNKGDMEVSIYVVTSDQTAYSGYNDYVGRSGSYYHYGSGYGYGYGGAYGGMYGSNNTYKTRSKLMGTIIMNIYDGSKNQIWQVIGESAVEKNPAKRERSIPAKVSNIMRRFPISPGKNN